MRGFFILKQFCCWGVLAVESSEKNKSTSVRRNVRRTALQVPGQKKHYSKIGNLYTEIMSMAVMEIHFFC